MREYVCVTCGRSVAYEPPLPALYPFCSPRCQWVDIGRWLQGDYSIERDVDSGNLSEHPGSGADRDSDGFGHDPSA